MLFRARRDRRGPDRFLTAKMAILGIGGAVAIAGFALRIDWLITVATFVLVIGLALNISRMFGTTPSAENDTSSDEPGT